MLVLNDEQFYEETTLLLAIEQRPTSHDYKPPYKACQTNRATVYII